MKKNLVKIIAVLVVGFASILAYQQLVKKDGEVGEKVIHVQIIDKSVEPEKVILNESFNTDALTLEEFLTELSNNGKIKLETATSAYGKMITGLGSENLLFGDGTDNKWWSYSSLDNQSCAEFGYCDGMSILNIEDGNHFIFTLEKY